MWRKSFVVFAIPIGVVLSSIVSLIGRTTTFPDIINNDSLSFLAQETPGTPARKKQRRRPSSPLASKIVSHAYRETWGRVRCFSDGKNQTWRECLMEHRTNNAESRSVGRGSSSTSSWPWWFQTMLRDCDPWVFRPWHVLPMRHGELTFCTMEKVGINHFKKLQCLSNGVRVKGKPCGRRYEKLNPGAPRAVFLRDPLERFLSGFLDKCVSRDFLVEKHCEPGPVFQNEEHTPVLLRDIATTEEGENDDSVMRFATFVDVMPLKWNLHFFPQALYCDGLGRDIGDYDFVGRMGTTFYDDLHEMGERFLTYDSSFRENVDEVFDLTRRRKMSQEDRQKAYYEQAAATKVLKYYTPRTLRRVLELLAIDYVTLGLEIPEWAEDILRNETSSIITSSRAQPLVADDNNKSG